MSKLQLSCLFLFCIAAVIATPAQSAFLATLLSFNGSNGASPYAPLLQGADGSFYGTTEAGGPYGGGTVFKITSAGTLTTLYSFCSQPTCVDGSNPGSGLVQAADSNFYGTTVNGGTYGLGTVFKIAPSGALTTLYSFEGMDGATPVAGLIQATDGKFYGTAYDGGAYGWGTVFQITPTGTLSTLYNFCSQPNCTDGANPFAALVQATDSNYATTQNGGTYGLGTVFKIAPSGALTTLHSFDGTEGGVPLAGLVQATDGNFYGTTYLGGAGGVGAIFKISPAGTLTTLYSFGSEPKGGGFPWGGLVQGSDGNFYGTTTGGGGPYNGGTVFKITATGTLITLHSFAGPDGADPSADLMQATDGNLYGTALGGGAYGYGTVFRIGLVRTCATCGPLN